MKNDPRQQTIDIVRSFAEGETKEAGVHLSLEVRGRRFGWYMEDHHGDGRIAINCKAAPGVSHAMVDADPNVYHIPSYVGNKGWVGIWLDVEGIDWDEVRGLLHDAYLIAAPRSLLKQERLGSINNRS